MKKVIVMFFLMVVGFNVVLMVVKVKVFEEQEIDVLLIGGGIMSVMLGIYLCELEFEWLMIMVECLEGVVQESLNGWNNVGIGYFVLMELNYIL